MQRPPLNQTISISDFKEYYWLRKELVAFCKTVGIPSNANKIELTRRVILYLETGKFDKMATENIKKKSNFDWINSEINLKTIITDNYKNTENVRRFFENQCGKNFRFTVMFMNWMKQNIGKTLANACEEWKLQNSTKKNSALFTEIAPQFEYNQYMRDFLADNPQLGSKDAIKFWKIKRSMRGTNKYEKSDLNLKSS